MNVKMEISSSRKSIRVNSSNFWEFLENKKESQGRLEDNSVLLEFETYNKEKIGFRERKKLPHY